MKNKKRLWMALIIILSLVGTNKAHAWIYTLPDIGVEVSYDYNYVYPLGSIYPLTFGAGVWWNLLGVGGPTMSASFGIKHKTKFFNTETIDSHSTLSKCSDYNFVLSPGFCTGICSIKLGLGGCRINTVVTSSDITTQSLYGVDSFVANINASATNSWTFMFQPAFTLNVPLVPGYVILPLRVGYNYVPEYKELCGLFVGASIVFGL